MKKLLLIFLILPLISIGQDYTDFLPEVAWRTIVDSVVYQNADTFTVKVNPTDLNDPGAFQKTIGNFLVDNKRRKYEIINNSALSDGILLTVVDVFESGAAPYQGRVGFVIETPNGAFASGLSTYYGEELDKIAADYERAIDLRIAYEKGQTIPFDSSRLWTGYNPTGTEPIGTSYYDKENRTISVALGNGVVMQINQESLIQVHNGSGDTIMDGRIMGAIGGASDRVSVGYANKANRYDALIMSTEIIAPDSLGLACEIAGRVNGVNTGAIPIGKIYLDTLGLITDNPGEFPDYNYPLGAVVKTGVTDGIIQFRSDGANFRNDVRNAFDGAIRETFDFRTFSNGTTVYGVLSNPDTSDSTLTLMFSDDWHDFVVPDTIELTAGTATNPQQSWVYIDQETRTLQSSTSGFPSTEHAEIAKITLLDASNTQTYGALRNQNTNNHLKYTNNNGHIIHMGDRIRVLNAQWEDGVALTVSGTPTNLYLSTTSGHVWQMHKQSFVAQDMASGDDIHIVNDFTTPFRTTTNLNTVTTYSDGSTWNNAWQNLVLWGVANKKGEISHIMLNLASDGYLSEDDAIADRNNYANYVIPREFRGVGFLIARITVRRSPSGYTYNPSTGYLDLRGYYPNNTAGGGTGSSGITEFTQLDDTPSSYTGQAYKFVRVDAGETALEFVDGSQILLTDFDSTGFLLEQSQIVGLIDTIDSREKTSDYESTQLEWIQGGKDANSIKLSLYGSYPFGTVPLYKVTEIPIVNSTYDGLMSSEQLDSLRNNSDSIPALRTDINQNTSDIQTALAYTWDDVMQNGSISTVNPTIYTGAPTLIFDDSDAANSMSLLYNSQSSYFQIRNTSNLASVKINKSTPENTLITNADGTVSFLDNIAINGTPTAGSTHAARMIDIDNALDGLGFDGTGTENYLSMFGIGGTSLVNSIADQTNGLLTLTYRVAGTDTTQLRLATTPTTYWDIGRSPASGSLIFKEADLGVVAFFNEGSGAFYNLNALYNSGEIYSSYVENVFGSNPQKNRNLYIGDEQGITLNPGVTTFGGRIQGAANGHLLLDLRNNDSNDAIAFRFSDANNTIVDAIGFYMNGNGDLFANYGLSLANAPTDPTDVVRLQELADSTAQLRSEIPTALSELTNDVGYWTSDSLPSNIAYNNINNNFSTRQTISTTDTVLELSNNTTNGVQLKFINSQDEFGWIKFNVNEFFNISNATTAPSLSVDDDPYGVGWNGSTQVPTKNAVYDAIEAISSGAADGYISNLSLSNNTLTSTGVLNGFNGTVSSNIANIGYTNTFTGDQTIDAGSLILTTPSYDPADGFWINNPSGTDFGITAYGTSGLSFMYGTYGSTTNEGLRLSSSGEIIMPNIDNASQTYQLYYNLASGEVTYDAAGGTNIYNTSSSFTSDRTATLGNYYVTWTGDGTGGGMQFRQYETGAHTAYGSMEYDYTGAALIGANADSITYANIGYGGGIIRSYQLSDGAHSRITVSPNQIKLSHFDTNPTETWVKFTENNFTSDVPIKANKGVSFPYRTVTANTTITSDDYTVRFTSTTGSITFTLPTASSVDGHIFILSNNSSSTCSTSISYTTTSGTSTTTIGANSVVQLQSFGSIYQQIN